MHDQRPEFEGRPAPAEAAPVRRSRLIILRDVVVFQLKLFVDGLRDVVLVPVSTIAAIVDVLAPGKNTGQHFYEVVRFGRRTERWIDLFSAADHLDDQGAGPGPDSIDEIVARAESKLKARYERARGPYKPPSP